VRGDRAAAMYSLIVTAKMNDVDPQAWLAGVLAVIAMSGLAKRKVIRRRYFVPRPMTCCGSGRLTRRWATFGTTART
jgi:hypothetical protein